MRIPQVLVEVKKSVVTVPQLDEQHLAQMFVQGYYCMIENSLEHVVVGLCDQIQFHFFGLSIVEKAENDPISPLSY